MRIRLSAVLLCLAGCGSGNKVIITPPPVLDTLRYVQGKIAYYTAGPDLNSRDAAGRLTAPPGLFEGTLPRGAGRLDVEILRPDGSLLGNAVTDGSGNYSVRVNFGKNPATQVMVRVTARVALPFGTLLTVRPAPAPAAPYAAQSPLGGNPTQDPMTVDLSIPIAQGSGAFHIVDTLHEGMEIAKSGILAATMPDVEIVWAPGNGDTSAFSGGVLTIAGGIPGNDASNRDEWDGPQLMRLLGLYLQAYFFREVAPPGVPRDGLLVPSAAWKEGFLDFWACAGRGSPEFWDTTGTGASGRVVRFFQLESFFDPALGSLGPDDPNVYQDPLWTGIESRYSIAEVLWDTYDHAVLGDKDDIQFPLYLLLRACAAAQPGDSYPYFITPFDQLASEQSLDPVKIFLLFRFPEVQDIGFPAAGDDVWPPPFPNADAPVAPPYDDTLSGQIDTANPSPPNYETGLGSQSHFRFRVAASCDAVATLTTVGDLRVEILDANNVLLATGTAQASATDLEPGLYIVRVRPGAQPQLASFDVRLQLFP